MTSTSRRRAALASSFAGLMLWGVAAFADPSADARATMEQTVAEVLVVLENPSLDLQAKKDAIQAIAYERFDFATMSKLVLKRDWKAFNPAQQEEFVVEFREHLSARYGENLGKYENEKVEVTGDSSETNGDVRVMTVIRGGQYDGTPVNYRLRHGSSWQVIDVVIENISLVSSFRSQFADVLDKSGPQGVLAKLKQRNAARVAAKSG